MAMKSELAGNDALRAKLESIRAGASEPERYTVTDAPLRDARGKVLDFHTVSLGVPGNAGPVLGQVLPPMPHLTPRTCQSTAPMRYPQPVSICRLVNESERSTSPLDARIRVLEARCAALEFAGGAVAAPAPSKAVQPASEPRSEAAHETAEYARYREAKAVEARYVPTQYSYTSYGR
jgi:hypothetical protein